MAKPVVLSNGESIVEPFGKALEIIKHEKHWGMKINDLSNQKVLKVQNPTELSKMTQSYLYECDGLNKIPYTPTQSDMMLSLWLIVEQVDKGEL